MARPSVSEERLSINDRDQVVYKLKKSYDNGTTHIVFEPTDFLARLASLVPRPRVNLIRYHGVFSPNFKHRKLVVPKPSSKDDGKESDVIKPISEQKNKRMTWAQRLKRVFQIDIEKCPDCGGQVKIIASIEDPKVITKILDHLGLESRVPISFPARGPPSDQIEVQQDFEVQQFPEYE